MTRTDKIISYAALWVARGAIAVLSFAGAVQLLGGVDKNISYPIAGILVAFLIKETL